MVGFSYIPTFQTELFCILLSEVIFLRMKIFFLRLKLSRGTIFAAEIGQAVFGGRSDARGHKGARTHPPSLMAAR